MIKLKQLHTEILSFLLSRFPAEYIQICKTLRVNNWIFILIHSMRNELVSQLNCMQNEIANKLDPCLNKRSAKYSNYHGHIDSTVFFKRLSLSNTILIRTGPEINSQWECLAGVVIRDTFPRCCFDDVVHT